ncbi:MAG: DNA recombination protein RmuC [Gammaproteobacteria bacterium HGW-Gammaproteobacteria-1]|jgi:DNA recombination protein RmuC|nr:MAG: DNA recombination protein RmuC [Gammaproteobacteria bacterium HGW-Gammaproteobacteria-1]
MTETYLLLLILATLLAALLSAAITYFLLQRRVILLREDNARLQAELDGERRSAIEKSLALEQVRENLAGTFSTMASEALKHNSGEFLRLAQENLKQFHVQAQGELAQREKAVENLVKPIREALEKTEKQIQEVEKSRAEAYGSLTKHLESMAEAHRMLQGETRNLVQALRRPEVRGQWGEMTLKRLAELAGMVEHCDFFEQEQVRTEDGNLRPDMIVRMPDGRDIIVDAKTPLDAYLSAIEAGDDETRRKELERHARKVRERVRELSAKAYWQQFKNTPDFVVLFIPGEQFLSAALELDRKLLEDALSDKVILATPTSFIALLRAVAYGWRQQALAENAEQIRKLGEELYGRVATFTEHLGRLGKSLESSVGHFNKTVGTFDTRVLPSMRRFNEMGISAKKELSEVAQIEVAARDVTADEDKP